MRYIVDHEGKLIAGSERQVDFEADPDHYHKVKEDLESKMGEGCMVKDSEVDG